MYRQLVQVLLFYSTMQTPIKIKDRLSGLVNSGLFLEFCLLFLAVLLPYLIFMHTSFLHQFTGTDKFNMAAARRSEPRKLQKDREGAQFRSQFIQVVYVVLVILPSGFNCGYHSYSAL